MARAKITGASFPKPPKVKVFQAKGGFFALSLEAQEGALALFSPKHRKTIWQEGMYAAVEWFLEIALPARFSPYVRKTPFNYKGGAGKKKVDKNPMPLVSTGSLKGRALMGSVGKITATQRRANATIHIPLPSFALRNKDDRYIANAIRDTLGSITESEGDIISEVMSERIAEVIDSSEEYRRGKKGKARRRLVGV